MASRIVLKADHLGVMNDGSQHWNSALGANFRAPAKAPST